MLCRYRQYDDLTDSIKCNSESTSESSLRRVYSIKLVERGSSIGSKPAEGDGELSNVN